MKNLLSYTRFAFENSIFPLYPKILGFCSVNPAALRGFELDLKLLLGLYLTAAEYVIVSDCATHNFRFFYLLLSY